MAFVKPVQFLESTKIKFDYLLSWIFSIPTASQKYLYAEQCLGKTIYSQKFSIAEESKMTILINNIRKYTILYSPHLS